MQIQAHQIQNVLRTYAHLEQLKRSETEETKKVRESEMRPDTLTPSEESFMRFNARTRPDVENDHRTES